MIKLIFILKLYQNYKKMKLKNWNLIVNCIVCDQFIINQNIRLNLKWITWKKYHRNIKLNLKNIFNSSMIFLFLRERNFEIFVIINRLINFLCCVIRTFRLNLRHNIKSNSNQNFFCHCVFLTTNTIYNMTST